MGARLARRVAVRVGRLAGQVGSPAVALTRPGVRPAHPAPVALSGLPGCGCGGGVLQSRGPAPAGSEVAWPGRAVSPLSSGARPTPRATDRVAARRLTPTLDAFQLLMGNLRTNGRM